MAKKKKSRLKETKDKAGKAKKRELSKKAAKKAARQAEKDARRRAPAGRKADRRAAEKAQRAAKRKAAKRRETRRAVPITEPVAVPSEPVEPVRIAEPAPEPAAASPQRRRTPRPAPRRAAVTQSPDTAGGPDPAPAGDRPATRAELYRTAQRLEIPGRSTMTRDELAAAVARAGG